MFQAALIAAAVVLPHVAHVAHAPVYWLLPMHWPVVLAGLVYGPAGGLAVGVLSPVVSFSLSGMPPLGSVATMAAELGLYGLLTGLLRGGWRWNAVFAVALALLAGRVVAIGLGAVLGRPLPVLLAAYAKGLPCALAQVAVLPMVGRWWVAREGGGGRA